MEVRRLVVSSFVLLLVLAISVHAGAKEDIVAKLCDIISLGKYVAGAFAVGGFVYVGAEHLTAGNNPQKREELKGKVSMIVIGMLIIFFANYIVGIFLPEAASCPLI